tara:strand:- start:1149 stop:1598 length:450 start_codon:yes stop_codon:yes gene_type:complete
MDQNTDFTPQDEIIVYNKNRFYPKLPQQSINNLIDIFCVQSLEKTRCFSVEARPVRLTENAKKWLGIINDEYTIKDMNSLLKGKTILVVRTDTSNPGQYIVLERKFHELGTNIAGYPYLYSYVNIEHNGEIEENIALKRIFMSKNEIII